MATRRRGYAKTAQSRLPSFGRLDERSAIAGDVSLAVAGEEDIAVVMTWRDAAGNLHGQRFAYASDVLAGTQAGDRIGGIFDIASGVADGASGVAGFLDGRCSPISDCTRHSGALPANTDLRPGRTCKALLQRAAKAPPMAPHRCLLGCVWPTPPTLQVEKTGRGRWWLHTLGGARLRGQCLRHLVLGFMQRPGRWR